MEVFVIKTVSLFGDALHLVKNPAADGGAVKLLVNIKEREHLIKIGLAGDTPGYIVYLPDEMTDEQLLQYIDHDAKKRYVNNEQLKKDGIEPGVGMALESTKVAEGSPVASLSSFTSCHELNASRKFM